ncbi:glycosyltransferase family 4 protein [Allorhizobium sp. BGMRC 0089]|uniref:glycosyltransferase family 4 protein n=1 Tax=Allorhizobium sonneratiae TaxID=2934936 RepID=UPI0020347F1D|nr:glycosyltransferase family 4 protein [Allorhizobium sonneratiae]MCM2291939.1 glycosyltransferase family 4 protein [Allorhizobium sonneratiae]
MATCRKLAFVGNSLPRHCGIATFTSDVSDAISVSFDEVEVGIVAMTDGDKVYPYPPKVIAEIHEDTTAEYVAAADLLNAGGYDIVSLQHEFGIFGGVAGRNIMALVSRLKMPVVTTLHTVLAEPSSIQKSVLLEVVAASTRVIVMADKGRALLQSVYGVPATKIDVIAHGIPGVPYCETGPAKTKLGFVGKTVILTFGLLSPNKGIEVMIDAMPEVLRACPDAIYVVLGATHPNLVREQGEAYREKLQARALDLGVEKEVIFLDQFVDLPKLLDFISMSDVYVTPYLDEEQMTSGTLAYSFGLGKAVVSTPYWHARELLADGRGLLVPFNDPGATGNAIAELLGDAPRRAAMERRAYECSRSMTWGKTAEKYMKAFGAALRVSSLKLVAPVKKPVGQQTLTNPPLNFGHFHLMCDGTGIYQHAVYSVPDRSHGYCVDDNARALILACDLFDAGERAIPETTSSNFAAFIQHAWNPEVSRFRNFMSFSRNWLEEEGSEDSHGRTLWALGVCAASDKDPSRRRWASALFSRAFEIVATFTSPRAWAFTLLGLDRYCASNAEDHIAADFRLMLAGRLLSLLEQTEKKDWVWFEGGLSYDNGRLPQALLLTGVDTETPRFMDAGLRSLAWLMSKQIAPGGYFRPVGTDGFFDVGHDPRPFDQQPVEATAMISACLAAWRVTGDETWKAAALLAYGWFGGKNDLSTPLIDEETGGCRDGLHVDRANENQGGESVICHLLSSVEIRQLSRLSSDRPQPLRQLA